MSQPKLPKKLEEDIELIAGLENVEIRGLCDSAAQNGREYDDESQGIQFRDSSVGSDTQTYRFEVRFRLTDSVYAISRKSDCLVTLHVELDDDLRFPRVQFSSISNSSLKLKRKCERYLSNVAFARAPGADHSIYKLVIDFKAFLQYESQNEDLHPISDTSSLMEDLITLSISSANDGTPSPAFLHNERRRETARYYSMAISRKDEIYGHLATHSRYFREFKEEAVLGSGSFGCVTRALRNGITYAVKQIPIVDKYENLLHEEAAVLASLQHPNIVRYYDAWLEESPEYLLSTFGRGGDDFEAKPGGRADRARPHRSPGLDVIRDDESMNFEPHESNVYTVYNKHRRKGRQAPRRCLFILMEFCQESLLDRINSHTLHEAPQQCVELFRQLMEALSYIHEKGIIHRDVKPSNIFLKGEDETLIKLGDFGLTAKLQESKGALATIGADKAGENGVVGTLHYMAPEQRECDGHNDKVDIYSAGVVLFEMLARPFQTFMERFEILASFSTNDKQWPEGFRQRTDHRLLRLLEAMLNVNPNKRPTASEILGNEIFSSNKLDVASLYTVITQYPHSAESVQLLSTMFARKQEYRKLSEYYSFATSNHVVNYVNAELGAIYDREFRLRNASRTELALLTHLPSLGAGADAYRRERERPGRERGGHRDRLLLSDGRCCYLRHSLLHALAECIPKDLTTILRRYAHVPVYAAPPQGGAGRGLSYFLGYDVVVDYLIILNEGDDAEMDLDAFFTYELVAVASRPLKRFLNCTLALEWNHSELIGRLLRFAQVPEAQLAAVEALMLAEAPVKGRLAGLSDEASALVASLHAFLHRFKGRVGEFRRGVEAALGAPLSPELAAFLDKLRFFEAFLADFEGTHWLNPTYSDANSGCNSAAAAPSWGADDSEAAREPVFEKFHFRIFLEVGRRNFGDFVFGGCYNRLVENNIRRRNAFGFEMSLQPVYDHHTQNMVNKSLYNNLHLNYAPEVVVYTPQVNLITAATSLESKFWRAGLKCYKKVGGQLNTKRIARLKRAGLFSLQRLKSLITIKRTTENYEVQYVVVDIDVDTKKTFGGEDHVLGHILHDVSAN